MLQDVVLATRNRGKIAELAGPLGALGVRLLGLGDFPGIGEIEETGSTFEENALVKAKAVAEATGLASVADDSGLEVDALGGRPGVRSARYADDLPPLPGETKDMRCVRRLLAELEGVPAGRRGARFVCRMAAVSPDPAVPPLVVGGEWRGRILEERRGSNGFGYDPVFLDIASNLSAAEMDREAKNARSHRGAAVAALLRAWPTWPGRRAG